MSQCSSVRHDANISDCYSFCSNPIAAGVSKRRFQIALCLVAAFYCWRVYTGTIILAKGSIGAFQCSSARMRVLEQQGITRNSFPINQTISSFGLLRDGCAVPGGNVSFQIDHEQLVVRVDFPSPINANGYYFVTSEAGSSGADPVRWTVEVLEYNSSAWLQVGASAWRQYSDGTLGLYSQLPFPTPTSRDYRVTVDYRIPWEWIVDAVVANIIYAAGWFSSAFTGLIGREHWCRTTVLNMSILAALFFLVEAIGYHLDGLTFTAISLWIEYGPTQLIWIIGIAFFEAQIIWTFFFFSISVLVTLVARDSVLYGQSVLVPVNSFCTSSGMLILLFVVTIFYFRRRTIKRATNLVMKDMAHYDSSWSAVIGDPESMRALITVRQISQQLDARCVHPARQLNRQLPCHGRPLLSLGCGPVAGVMLAQSAMRVDAMGELKFANPVCSLDQLFVQASCLEPLLREKVKVRN